MLKTKNLYFKYKTFNKSSFELNNINIEIKKNQFVLFLGKSGSGKSTLIKVLAGLENDYKGKIEIDGNDIKKLSNLRNLISVSFQFPENQFFLDTVRDEITFGLRLKNLTNEQIIKRVIDVCKMVDFPIGKFEDYSPFDLSSGYQRRLALAILFSLDTDILILDEPLCGIDNNGRKTFIKLFEKIKYNKTIICITHSPEELFYLTDRVMIINNGAIIFDKNKEDLLKMNTLPDEIINYLPENFWFAEQYKRKGIKLKENFYSPKNLAKELVKLNVYQKR